MHSTKEVVDTDFTISLLRDELTLRCRDNARYSLRQFAKYLGLSHSALSLILSGRRKPSIKMAYKISKVLGLGPDQVSKIIGQVDKVKKHQSSLPPFRKIDLQTFEMISDWVHYGILSLLETRTSAVTVSWIARRLGINETHAKACFGRLNDLGLIDCKSGRWRQTGRPLKVDNLVSTATTRKFQKQLLEKAIFSLENDPVSERDFTSITFAMNPEDLEFAKFRIKEFRRSLTADLEKLGKPKEVYNLTIQLYPLTKAVN